MELIDLVKDRDSLNAWIKGWQDDCRAGRRIGIRMIHDFAEKIKFQYCTNDVWNPGAKVAYDLLLNAADQCRQLYETQKNRWRNDEVIQS